MADIIASILPSVPPHLTSWIPGRTPMSTWSAAVTAILSYLMVIFSLRELMKSRPALNLKTPFRIHNACLSLASLVLLGLTMEEVVKLCQRVSAYDTVCAGTSWTKRLEFYYIVNYYFKYIEFLDTVFLVLRKRPLTFLHVFHHSATALMTFVGFQARIGGTWLITSTNLAIHVVMYYYYFKTAGGAKFWWKKYLTTMQILQFVFFILVGLFGLYQRLAFTYFPFLPHMGDCDGDLAIAVWGMGIITSFLVLFINFYCATYERNDGNRIRKEKKKLVTS